MFPTAPRTRLLMAGVGISLLIAGGLLWFFLHPSREELDATFIETLVKIPDIYSYTQHNVTETEISGRHLTIEGVYDINGRDAQFASSATTTLTIPDESGTHSFNLMNVSLNNDVYFKIETESEFLKKTILHSPEWRHFKRDAIPAEFKDIAIWGPIIDTLLLFRENGAYISLLKNHGAVQQDGETLAQYTFERSDKDASDVGGTLATLLDRIGAGTIDVWVDPVAKTVRHIVITSDNYAATTTISNINSVSGITSPPLPAN